jgi:hypothetical protein
MKCPDHDATTEQEALNSMLQKLQTFDTPDCILNILEEHLSDHLRCPASNKLCRQQDQKLTQQQQRNIKMATQHQNIIGWDNYL